MIPPGLATPGTPDARDVGAFTLVPRPVPLVQRRDRLHLRPLVRAKAPFRFRLVGALILLPLCVGKIFFALFVVVVHGVLPRSVESLPHAQGTTQHAPVVVVFGLFFATTAITFECHFFSYRSSPNELLLVTPAFTAGRHTLMGCSWGDTKYQAAADFGPIFVDSVA